MKWVCYFADSLASIIFLRYFWDFLVATFCDVTFRVHYFWNFTVGGHNKFHKYLNGGHLAQDW